MSHRSSYASLKNHTSSKPEQGFSFVLKNSMTVTHDNENKVL